MKKVEAAKIAARRYYDDEAFAKAEPDMFRVGYEEGWTQHGEEVMKRAREKKITVRGDGWEGEQVKLSDLEAIIEELGK